MNVIEKIVGDIILLEKVNMTPILNQHGKHFNADEVVEDIRRNNPELGNVFCFYSATGSLLGYVRFNNEQGDSLCIRSLQLSNSAKKATILKRLMYHGYQYLVRSDLADAAPICSWVNTLNVASIKLHEKMGFRYVTGHRDASKFEITKTLLLERLKKMDIHNMFTQKTHQGNFPVRLLGHNIPHTLQTHLPEREALLKSAVEKGLMQRGIDYHISDEWKMIYADNVTKKVCVHEPFLAYLWAFIYSTYVMMEEGIMMNIMKEGKNQWDGNIDNTKSLVQRAQKLYLWAKSLPGEVTLWPAALPSPEFFDTAEEQFYIEKANGIYALAVTYLINHEFAHLVNGHWNVLKEMRQKNTWDLTASEKANYKVIEQEADRYAQEEIVPADADDSEKLVRGISIVLAHCAALFAIAHPSGLIAELHPDTDTRIFHSINFLDLKNQDNVDYIYLTAAVSCNLFLAFNESKLSLAGYTVSIPPSVADSKEYFEACLRMIDEIKAIYINEKV